jgi:ABC-type amino acid transport substrate-binding protein
VVIDVIGWVGVGLYVVAYYMVSASRVSGRSRVYQWMNLFAALGVAANAFAYDAFPSAIVNVIWFFIAAITLLGLLRPSDEKDPGHPESPEGRGVHRIFFFAGGILLVCAVAMTVLIAWPKPPEPPRPILVTTGEWEPYIGTELDRDGHVAELARDVFRRAGYRVSFDFRRWDVAFAAAAAGQADASMPWIKSREREGVVLFSEPLLEFRYVLFYNTNNVDENELKAWIDSRIKGESRSPSADAAGGTGTAVTPTNAAARQRAEDAAKYTLGRILGYEIWESLGAEMGETIAFATAADAFVALERGEVDLVAESVLAGERVLYDPSVPADASAIRFIDVEGGAFESSEQQLHIVAPDTPSGRALIRRVNRAIQSLRSDGVIDALEATLDSDSAARLNRAVRVRTVGVVEAFDQASRYALPAGTEGVVVKWPEGFVSPNDPNGASASPDDKARVKISNGPLAGRILLLSPDAFEVVPSEARR